MEQPEEFVEAVIISGDLTGQFVQISASRRSNLFNDAKTTIVEMNLEAFKQRQEQLETIVRELREKVSKLKYEKGELENRVFRLELQREADHAQIVAEVEIMKLQIETRTLRCINSWPRPSDQ